MAFLEIEVWLQQPHYHSSEDVHNSTVATSDSGGGGVGGTKVPEDRTSHGDSNLYDPNKYTSTQSPPFSVVVILIDFLCEVTGFFASFVLIRGLQQERKGLLLPWMIIVPTHTLIDVYTACDIVIAYIKARYKDQDLGQDNHGTVILVSAVSLTALINIYALVCVISQYQDFSEGRGTASFENMLMQNGDSVQYTCGRERVSLRQNRPMQKSEIWCDDIGFGKPSQSKNRRESQGNGTNMGASKDRVPTVRFENESSSSSGGDSAETRQRFLGNFSKSDKDSFGRSLIVPGKNSRSTLMEESTTADSIEEM